MRREDRDAVVDLLRSGDRVVVVRGDHDLRALAGELASREPEAVEVRPEGPLAPWRGIGVLVDALQRWAPARVPPALDAARHGAPGGDHLGLGSDLRALLAGAHEAGRGPLVVHDAHLLDLSSAGALTHALDAPQAGLRVVVTQGPGPRGIGRSGGADGAHGDCGGEPWDLTVTEPERAPLDAAWIAERRGDHVTAARWWLDAGRPDRCRQELDRVGDGVAAALEVGARLAHRTCSARRWQRAIDGAVAALAPERPVVAARLLLLQASARLNRGDTAGGAGVLDEAARLLERADDDRERRAVADLHELVAASVAVSVGRDHARLLDALDRPVARLGAALDADAVRLISAATMPLGWAGHLADARAVLDRLTGVLQGRRRYLPLPQPLATSAWLARRRARVDVARSDGARAIELGRAAGADNDVRFALAEVTHVEALRGRLDACREHVAALVPDGVPRGAAQISAVSALAVGKLLADEPGAAVELLEPVHAAMGTALSPAHTAWRHNLAEAYVRTGREAQARRVLGELEAWAARAGSPREHGQVAWCRGMLAPAGTYDEHFDCARTLLEPYPGLRWRCESSRLRRLVEEDRGAEAAVLAERLLAEAAEAGVPAGADQIRRLQARLGVPPRPVPSDPASLSVDDLRVALALVEGADDDEIAGRLHLTGREVDQARARVLAVLDVVAGDLDAILPLEPLTPGVDAAEIRILGPTLVARGAEHSVPPAGRPATVLGLVAAEGSLTVDRVLDVLWPDADPVRTRPRLRNVLARLRSAVGPVVERDGDLLVLGPDVVVDSHRFEALVERALRARGEAVEREAERALAAWTGPPLPSWPYEDWAEDVRRRLTQRCTSVLRHRAEVRAGAGHVEGALDDLDQALALQPDDGEVWAAAIDLARRHGRDSRARALWRRAVDRGIEVP